MGKEPIDFEDILKANLEVTALLSEDFAKEKNIIALNKSESSIIVIGGSGGFFNKTDTRTANTILAGPTSGSAAAPTFRSLVVADIPTLTSAKVSDFDTQVRTNRVDQLASATNPVSGVTPTADAHFAIKSYVDGVAQGLDIKEAARVATTANGHTNMSNNV